MASITAAIFRNEPVDPHTTPPYCTTGNRKIHRWPRGKHPNRLAQPLRQSPASHGTARRGPIGKKIFADRVLVRRMALQKDQYSVGMETFTVNSPAGTVAHPPTAPIAGVLPGTAPTIRMRELGSVHIPFMRAHAAQRSPVFSGTVP